MKLRHLIAVMLFFPILGGCSKGNSSSDTPPPPADPAGTVNYNLTFYPQVALFDNCNCLLTYPVNGPQVPNGVVSGSMSLTLNTSVNFSISSVSGYGSCKGTYQIASVGAIAGLGAITSHPSGGYTTTVAATKGNGYVVQATDYDPTAYTLTRVRYYRFYVTDYILSTSNAVLGVYLKYQGPF